MSEMRYGDDKTIHRTGEVNVERDPKTGAVVSVWFRCALIKFTDTVVDAHRAQSMRDAYADFQSPNIKAIVFEVEEDEKNSD